MEALGKEGYEHVAVFDADFKPEPSFLHRTVPYLLGNPEVRTQRCGVAWGMWMCGECGLDREDGGRRGLCWYGRGRRGPPPQPASPINSPPAPCATPPRRCPRRCRLQVGYVQSRWVFTNPQESYLTKAQEVSLNYHMKCEQYTHSATGSFFNFNGTAGEQS